MTDAEESQNARGSPARKRPTASSDCAAQPGAVAMEPDRADATVTRPPNGGVADTLDEAKAAFRAAAREGQMSFDPTTV
jgi:hypothetical protein